MSEELVHGSKNSKISTNAMTAFLVIVMCTILNVACNRFAIMTGIPIFFNSVGTVCAAVLGGYLPGIITAIATGLIKGLYISNAAYFMIFDVLIAAVTAYFVTHGYHTRRLIVIAYILILTAISGVGGSILSWLIEGKTDFIYTCAINLADKIATVFLLALTRFILPQNYRNIFKIQWWKQTPLTPQEREKANKVQCRSHSLRTKIVLLLVLAAVSLAVTVTWISLILFKDYSRNQHAQLAEGTAKMAASVINGDKVEDYITRGNASPQYHEVEKLLYNIRNSSPEIEYVYVYKVMPDGCHVVFDLDTDDVKGSSPGDIIQFDKAFEPYLDTLLLGGKIDTIISNETFGWLMTAYEPVRDHTGQTVCYAAADIAMRDLRKYEIDFFVKLLTLFLSFFLLILSIGLYISEYHVILPINSIAAGAGEFAFRKGVSEQDNVNRIRSLKISTGDEVENLYHAFEKMTEDSVSYMEDIQKQSETISNMQTGLIMVMADMVESRDSNTGDHVKKTAAYVDIVMRSLKEKGYYADELTEEYMSDVIKSAPLHDIGKINVPDSILNKPARLEDNEFEKMKSHTTAGKDMIEKAITKVRGESYLKEARDLAAYHHEKWDGTGYPSGLKGEEIPLSARIMAIADVFDALVSERIYKKAFSYEKAMAIIKDGSGKHFDPKVVEAFVDSSEEIFAVADKFGKKDSPDPGSREAV